MSSSHETPSPTPSLNAAGTYVGPAPRGFYITTFVLETVFLAAFIGTYSYGSWLILYRAHPSTRRQTSTIVLFLANTAMFILTLLHWALDVDIARKGFYSVTDAQAKAKFVMYISQVLIGDGFMIYRLFRVYSCHWPVIVAPTILLIVAAGIGYSCAFLGVPGFYMSVAFYAISLIVNVICTVCIMMKVFRISRDFHGVYLQGHKLKVWKVLEATVQSTAIYSAAAVALVVTFVNSTELGYPACLDIYPAIIGLVFSFVAIRIAHNLTRDDTTRPDSNFQLTETARSRQTASTMTYVERDNRRSFIDMGQSPTSTMKGYKEKLDEEEVLDFAKDKHRSMSEYTTMESMTFASPAAPFTTPTASRFGSYTREVQHDIV